MQAKYQGSLVLFLAKALGSSNILLLPRLLNPLLLGHHAVAGLADLMDILDLSKLSLDDDYIEEFEEKQVHAHSLQEGIENAAEVLWDGFFGISDVFVKPTRKWREKGIRGLPEGLFQGLLSAVVKPTNGIIHASRSLLEGISQICRFRFLRQNARSRGRNKIRTASSEKAGQAPRSDEANTKGAPAPEAFEPFLRGTAGLRPPRLLFGDGTVVAQYVDWHAELALQLGPGLTQGVCAVWRLAGDKCDYAHVVLVATTAKMLLVDLNRGTRGRRMRKDALKEYVPEPTSASLEDRNQPCTRCCLCRCRAPKVKWEDFTRQKVIKSWHWKDVRNIDILDASEVGGSVSGRRAMKNVRFWLTIEDTGGHLREYPLIGSAISPSVLEALVNDIKQVAQDLGVSIQ